MLDDRKAAILRAVVQEYIATAQPVGSTHVARAPGVGVSSATVRNEMAVLEQEGYLAQPHTSAGRVPTDQGYRFFVDHLGRPGQADALTTRQVGEFFEASHGRLEEMLHHTSDLLTQLTRNAAVVVGPKAAEVPIRSAQIVRLSATAATVVFVFANGSVDNEVIEIGEEVSDAALAAATVHLSTHLVDRVMGTGSVPDTGDASTDELCRLALDAMSVHGSDDEPAYVGGVSTMAEAFDAVEVVRQVLHTLEQQFVVVSLVRDIVDRGMSVAIGVEHGVEPLSACSVVVAPVVVDGEHVGSVGVLGPTRMNYPQALATVDIVSDQLGRRLGDG
ncbi:heat-inducible transcription repressor HrcA [Ilumatobacter fluminis]|uniref:Heat-inducible transcription repressor HrcA n=1 Tax=Ilumatobacter fluminis TaxID=467091 RepID=A0A4R7I0A9_9ACTN|nr:heat-inducible transcriptional repressor HrcA [Ilumatobacter fluminis]TDT16851.1 heat-inducible transcription repressor HrcA [Ilumatobacter fluminis]